MAATLKDIELSVISFVVDNGEMTTPEIIDSVASTVEGAEPEQIQRMITKLDRAGTLTRQNNETGWQITANGRNALEGLRGKMEKRFVAPYKDYATVHCLFQLLTPSLGCVTEPGGVGISRFLRINEEYRYVEREVSQTRRGKTTKAKITEREVTSPGQIIFLGGYILGALQRAAYRSDSTVGVDEQGIRTILPDVAWKHVTVRPIVFPADQSLVKSVRRPTNTSGMAIGEIVHESLPAGTVLPITAVFPLSHFSEHYLVNLFATLEAVGISAAGTGKGGMWGIGSVLSLTVNGKELRAMGADYATGQSVTGLQSPAAVAATSAARGVLDSQQAHADTPAVDGGSPTATEAPAVSRDDRVSEHPLTPADDTTIRPDDTNEHPASERLESGAKARHAVTANAGRNGR